MIPPWIAAVISILLLIVCCIFGFSDDPETRKGGVTICLGAMFIILPWMTRRSS